MTSLNRRCFISAVGASGILAASEKIAIGKMSSSEQTVSDTLGFKSAIELAGMVRAKKISSVELTRYFIERIEKFDKALNAIPVRDFDRALEDARKTDEALAKGASQAPFLGLPMTIKESFDIAGLATTWGIPHFSDNVARTDSDMVQKLKGAGAHFLGKTNVPEALADFQAYNGIYGQTNNPWDISRIPGGSSGGSAAALAAGLTGLESGSDIGSSIRNPAHFCGVYGHKPTWNIISHRGHALPGSEAGPDLAVVGPMARSAEDLALSLELVSGPDHLNAPGWKLDLPEPRARSLKELRVALWADDEIAPVDREISKRVLEIGERLSRLGARVSEAARPRFSVREAHETYLNLLFSFMASSVTDEQFQQNQERAASFSPDDRSLAAIEARASVLDHRSWLHFNNNRAILRRQWQEFFRDWDIVLCPTLSTTAFKHDHRPIPERTLQINGKDVPYFQQIFWAGLATVSHLPSTVFPTGLSGAGLPIGLQAISAEYHDRTTIEFARLMAQEIGGFQPPPGFED